MADDSKGQAAVYVGWTTFINTLNALAEGIPNVIDKSVFAGQSGGVQSQLMAGLKFLGLIDDNGKPSADLSAVVTRDEVARKAALAKILKRCYADLFALDLTKATAAQLSDTMGQAYNVQGDTREKATRFFLSAVKYVELPLGRLLLQSKAATGGVPRKRRNTGRSANNGDVTTDDGDGDEEESGSTGGTSQMVSLRSGGTLTITASVDIFKLSPADRTFVFGLIDMLSKYESEGQQSPVPEVFRKL